MLLIQYAFTLFYLIFLSLFQFIDYVDNKFMRVGTKKQALELTQPEEQLKKFSLQQQQVNFVFSNEALMTAPFQEIDKWYTSEKIFKQLKSKETLSTLATIAISKQSQRRKSICGMSKIRKLDQVGQNKSEHNFKQKTIIKSEKTSCSIQNQRYSFLSLSSQQQFVKKKNFVKLSSINSKANTISFKTNLNQSRITNLKKQLQTQLKILKIECQSMQNKKVKDLILYPTNGENYFCLQNNITQRDWLSDRKNCHKMQNRRKNLLQAQHATTKLKKFQSFLADKMAQKLL